jgi:hypothetical protein
MKVDCRTQPQGCNGNAGLQLAALGGEGEHERTASQGVGAQLGFIYVSQMIARVADNGAGDAAPSFRGQFAGIFLKNIALKRGALKQTFYEFVFPVYFAAILYFISTPLKSPIDYPGNCTGGAANATCFVPLEAGLAPSRVDTCTVAAAATGNPGSVLLFSPNTSEARSIVTNALELLDASGSCALGFDSAREAAQWYLAQPSFRADVTSPTRMVVAAAVYLDLSAPLSASYTLALPPAFGLDLDAGASFYELNYGQYGSKYGGVGVWVGVWVQGPLALQWAMTRAIAMERNATLRDAILAINPTLPTLAALPVAPFTSSYTPGAGVKVLTYLFPIYMCGGLTAGLGYMVVMVRRDGGRPRDLPRPPARRQLTRVLALRHHGRW